MKKTILTAVLGLGLMASAGCGSSTGGGGDSFNPAGAQTQTAPDPGFYVQGSLPQGNLFLYLEPGNAPEVDGTGVIARGPNPATADLQPVSVRGTRIGSNLCVQLFPDDAAQNVESMLLAGVIGGEGSLSQPGQSPADLPVSLSQPQKKSVSPRFLDGALPERYSVECNFKDNDDVERNTNIDMTISSVRSGTFDGTYTSTVPFGPIQQESSGTVQARRYPGSDIVNFYLYNSRGQSATFVCHAPQDATQNRVVLDNDSNVVVSSNNPNFYRFGLVRYLVFGTLEVR